MAVLFELLTGFLEVAVNAAGDMLMHIIRRRHKKAEEESISDNLR